MYSLWKRLFVLLYRLLLSLSIAIASLQPATSRTLGLSDRSINLLVLKHIGESLHTSLLFEILEQDITFRRHFERIRALQEQGQLPDESDPVGALERWRARQAGVVLEPHNITSRPFIDFIARESDIINNGPSRIRAVFRQLERVVDAGETYYVYNYRESFIAPGIDRNPYPTRTRAIISPLEGYFSYKSDSSSWFYRNHPVSFMFVNPQRLHERFEGHTSGDLEIVFEILTYTEIAIVGEGVRTFRFLVRLDD